MTISMIGAFQLFLMLLVLLPGIILPVIALIDIMKHEFSGNNKLIWVLVVILLPILGSVLYLAMGTKQKSGPVT